MEARKAVIDHSLLGVASVGRWRPANLAVLNSRYLTGSFGRPEAAGQHGALELSK